MKCSICDKKIKYPFIFDLGLSSQIHLRICDYECFIHLVLEYLYEIMKHKDFYNWLYGKELPEDAEKRHKEDDEIMKLCAEELKKSFSKIMLSKPNPNLLKYFENKNYPSNDGNLIKFKRYQISNEDKIKWTKQNIERLEKQLSEEKEELNKLAHKVNKEK